LRQFERGVSQIAKGFGEVFVRMCCDTIPAKWRTYRHAIMALGDNCREGPAKGPETDCSTPANGEEGTRK